MQQDPNQLPPQSHLPPQARQAYAPPQYHAVAPTTNTSAVISLIMAILGWTLLPIIGSIVAIIFGHMARATIRRTGQAGDGMALIGLVLSYIALSLLLLGLLAFFVVMVMATNATY